MSAVFTDNAATNWLTIDVRSVRSTGVRNPMVILDLVARTTSDDLHVNVDWLQASLYFAHELVGHRMLPPGPVGRDTHVTVDIPATRGSLRWITETSGAAEAIGFQLRFTGVLHVMQEGEPRYATQAPGGQWSALYTGRGRTAELSFSISRSDWLTNIFGPANLEDYVFMEIAIPRGTRADWKSALARLSDAERHFVLGNDAEVFFQCRAALEALPGAPKNIFQHLPESEKRERVDSLFLKTVQFLHTGRHVRSSGKGEVGFPVDHRDAEFALSMTKLLLSYASRI